MMVLGCGGLCASSFIIVGLWSGEARQRPDSAKTQKAQRRQHGFGCRLVVWCFSSAFFNVMEEKDWSSMSFAA